MDVAPAASFGAATQRWFERAFGTPTPAQAGAWPAIARGEHVLVCAPTGSGKTLAAFLAGLDRLLGEGARAQKRAPALALPLAAQGPELRRRAQPALAASRDPRDGSRPRARSCATSRSPCAPATHPPTRGDAWRAAPRRLITTPESLFLMLTSSQREILRGRQDGDHRRGARDGGHEARRTPGALARAALGDLPQRSHNAVCALGDAATARGGRPLRRRQGRPVTIVDAGVRKELDLEVRVPVEDLADLGYRATPAGHCRARSRTCRARRTAGHVRSGPPSTPSCSSSCAPTARP